MNIYVDQLTNYPSESLSLELRRAGTRWAHLWCLDLDNLHSFARRLGLKRNWYQDRPRFPHYDIVPSVHRRALECGAELMSIQTWLTAQRVAMVDETRNIEAALARYPSLVPFCELVSVKTLGDQLPHDEGTKALRLLMKRTEGTVYRREDGSVSITLFPRFWTSEVR